MIYVVLGMHKSGTTLVSQMLHKSGISMGLEFDEKVSYDEGNQWERRASWLINLDILGAEEDSYVSFDYYERSGGRPDCHVAARMRALCEEAALEASDWGFKDPLTCLTYSQWANVLPEHRVIAIYRHPGEVLSHYRCRGWDIPRAWRVLRAWTRYNEGIIDAFTGHNANRICLSYDALMTGDTEFDRLRAFVDRDLVDVRRPNAYRARTAHPLYLPVNRGLALTRGTGSARVLEQLAGLRHDSR